MTVEDLREILSRMPPDAKVCAGGVNGAEWVYAVAQDSRARPETDAPGRCQNIVRLVTVRGVGP